MRSLTPITVFLMIISVVFWVINRELVNYLAISALILLLVQVIILKQYKGEPAVFLNLILVIIIIVFDNIVKK